MQNSNNLMEYLKAIPHISDPLEQVNEESIVRARLFVEGTKSCLYIFHYDLNEGLWLGVVESAPGFLQFEYYSTLGFIKFELFSRAACGERDIKIPSFPQIDHAWIQRPLGQVLIEMRGQRV